jgi:MFS family permease
MVIFTLGELILIPASTTYAANLAPQDMRGRYMSTFFLSWGVAAGIGPIVGGISMIMLVHRLSGMEAVLSG